MNISRSTASTALALGVAGIIGSFFLDKSRYSYLSKKILVSSNALTVGSALAFAATPLEQQRSQNYLPCYSELPNYIASNVMIGSVDSNATIPGNGSSLCSACYTKSSIEFIIKNRESSSAPFEETKYKVKIKNTTLHKALPINKFHEAGLDPFIPMLKKNFPYMTNQTKDSFWTPASWEPSGKPTH